VAPATDKPLALTFALRTHNGIDVSQPALVTINVRGGNEPPTAQVSVPEQSVRIGETVHLDASGSSDPDGDALTYTWLQQAGPTVALTGIHAAASSFVAEQAGNYVWRVQVSDGLLTDARDVEIRVVADGSAPLARFSAAVKDGVVTFTDRSSGTGLHYSWDFGDGTARSHSANPAHAYASTGSYVARLTVRDALGQSDEMGLMVNVVVPPPDERAPARADFDPALPAGAPGLERESQPAAIPAPWFLAIIALALAMRRRR
jgi:PKD repeat protein